MRAEELMIGDWVQERSGAKMKIINIEYHCTRVLFNGEELILPCFEQANLRPIPLTPEILEKNGFDYKEKELGLYGVITAPHYVRDDVPFEVFCDGEPFAIWFKEPINIKYVHQLQNALRLCGIEKEITL